MKTTDFIIKRKVTEAVVEQPVEQVAEVKPTFPEFTMESANRQYSELLEDAGATCSSGVAVVMTQLGETPADMIKRQKAYTNQMTKGGPVKIKKAK